MPREAIIRICEAMEFYDLLRETTELNETLNHTIDEYLAMDSDAVAIDHYPPIEVDSSISRQRQREQLTTQYVERFEFKNKLEETMEMIQSSNNQVQALADEGDSFDF